MFHIIDLLSADEIKKARAAIKKIEFGDGAKTAGKAAVGLKRNLQAEYFSKSEIAQNIMRMMKENEDLRKATFPTTMSPLMLSKYEVGMEYGAHTDNVRMHNARVRTDLGMTLFLSDPDSYEGGELQVMLGNDERCSQLYKLPAGSLVVYPANYTHRVRKVESGERVAVICWMQSQYRDPEQREVMRELNDAKLLLHSKYKNSPVTLGAHRAINSLQRMWSDG